MASWTFATEAAPGVTGLPGLGRRTSLVDLFSGRGTDVLLGVGVAAFLAVLEAFLPHAFGVDSWLALVAGRDVWQSGLPHHETLTALAQGVPWVDQQWLSQLISYGAYLLGGLALLGLMNVALLTAAVAGSIVASRRLGASAGAVLLVLPICAAIVVYSREVRTQELALPLFVTTAYLLAADSRNPSRRVYWCLPLLVLWANVHGTVLLGAALVALRGLTVAWESRRSLLLGARAWLRPAALILGGAACLLATPYGLSIVSYYRGALLRGALRHAVAEWQPVTSVPVLAVLVFALAGAALWAMGRHHLRATRRHAGTTSWERLALLALAAASVGVLRNSLFFALLALLVLPVALSSPGGRRASAPGAPSALRARLNLGLAAVSVFAAVLLGLVTLARPNSAIELTNQRTGVLRAVEQQTAAHPRLKVFADVRFADWLLWRDPALAGRIANDARFELLTASQIGRLQDALSAAGPSWKRGLRGYRLIVLDRRYAPLAVAGLLREPGHRILYDDGARIVILRGAREAR